MAVDDDRDDAGSSETQLHQAYLRELGALDESSRTKQAGGQCGKFQGLIPLCWLKYCSLGTFVDYRWLSLK